MRVHFDPTVDVLDRPHPDAVVGPGERAHTSSPSIRATFTRALSNEGRRGVSLRVSMMLRWASYLLTVLVCSGITHAAFSYTPNLKAGGTLMLASSTVMFLTAALGAVAYANHRTEIIEQMRHFVFGIVVLPGTGIALLQWVLWHMNLDPSGDDLFVSLLNNSLPILYVIGVFIPMAVFIKTIAGMRSIRRIRLDDEEMMALYSRQDGLQR